MLTVTVDTAGRHGVAPCGGRAVETSALCACLRLMAGAAIDELELLGVPASLAACQVRVAFHAGEPGVNRRCARILGDEDGYLLVPAVAGKVRSGVTPEALLVVLGGCGARCQQEDRGDREESALPVAAG